MLGLILGGVAASCGAPAMAPEGFTIASEIRQGRRSAAEIAGDADLALERRRDVGRETVVAWGEVLDAALDSEQLDARRRARAYAEAVVVEWHGRGLSREVGREVGRRVGEMGGGAGGAQGGSVLFVFKPCVGTSSDIDYDAEVLEASIDGVETAILPRETRVGTLNDRNAGPLLTFHSVRLPPGAAGRTMLVRWRVRIFSAATTSPLAPDWEQTEVIAIPGGRAAFDGRRVRPVEDGR